MCQAQQLACGLLEQGRVGGKGGGAEPSQQPRHCELRPLHAVQQRMELRCQ
jgi:hypothetical protein